MLHDFKDILALTDKEPQWFDENGVPRFCKFHPRHAPNIYANEAVLYLIACQSCEQTFRVAQSLSFSDEYMRAHREHRKPYKIKDFIKKGWLHYGDPPCFGCAGGTMNCDDLKVLEYWAKDKSTDDEWQRQSEYEIDLPDFEARND